MTTNATARTSRRATAPTPIRGATRTSDYERHKYAATLAACGAGPFARALELGGSIGVFSALLAPRCERLVDDRRRADRGRGRRAGASPACPGDRDRGRDPGGLPPRAVRPRRRLRDPLLPRATTSSPATFAMFERELLTGGRLVAVHWRPAGAASDHGTRRRLTPTLAGLPFLWLTGVARAPTTTCSTCSAPMSERIRAAGRRRRPGRAGRRPRLPRAPAATGRSRSSPTSTGCPTSARR